MNYKKIIALMCLFNCILLNVYGQDWSQFLGPNENNTSPQKKLLRAWPAGGPQILWSVDVGIGYGGPVVKDGKVYLLDRVDSIGDIMRSFDLSNGKELWNYSISSPGSFPFPGSRSVPAVDENFVYACGALGDLYCFDNKTHKPVWNKNIWKDFGGGDIPRWAITQCPLIYNNLLIIASQAPGAGVVAYDKLTGAVKWTTPALGPVGYVSPVIVKIGSENQIVYVTASEGGGRDEAGSKGKVVGIEPSTGKVLWEYTNWQCHIPSGAALDAGNNKILITGGYNAGSAMISIDRNNDGKYNVKELFKTIEFGTHTLPPVLVNGYFYGQYSTNERKDGLVCMNMNGRVLWKTKRTPDFNKGSMILADGLILATDGSNKLYLIEPDTAGFKPLASSELLKPGGIDTKNKMTSLGGSTQNWAPTALADGKLLIRDQKRMICVKVAE